MPQQTTPTNDSRPDAGAAEKLFTAEQGIALLNERGFPITLSTFEKLDSPAVGDGPPVDAWWGRRKLRRADTLVAWAQARLSSERRASPHNWPQKERKRLEQLEQRNGRRRAKAAKPKAAKPAPN